MATQRGKRRLSEMISDEKQKDLARPRRRRVWLPVALACCMALAWFLPTIIAHSPLPGLILRSATADLNGSAELGSIELGWFFAPKLAGLKIYDSQDLPVAEVEAITLGRTLAALIWDRSNLGHIRIERPQVQVVLSDGSSNIEQVFAEYLESDAAGPLDIRFDLEVTDGSCSIDDSRTGQGWRIEPISLAVQMPAEPRAPIKIELQGQVHDEAGPSKFDLTLECNPSPPAEEPLGWLESLTAELKGVPLAMLTPGLERAVEGARISGRADATVRCSSKIENGKQKIAFAGEVLLASFEFTAAALGGDTVRLAEARASCQGRWSADRIEIDQIAVETEPARATLAGPLAISGGSPQQMLDSLLAQPCRMDADVDLARLAAMLPATLHVRQATRITSGKARLELSSRQEAGAARVHGQLDVAGLAAVREGRTIEWPQPVRAVLSMRHDADTLVIEKAHCASDFFQVDASGTAEEGAADIRIDLDRLARQMGELFDLSGLTLAGRGAGQLHWKLDESQQFNTRADFTLDDFRLARAEYPEWTEPQVRARLEAAGRIDPSGAVRLDSAAAETTIGNDRFEARLTKPLADLTQAKVWPVRLELTGDLARWQKRLGCLIGSTDWRSAGNFQLVAQADLSPESILIHHGKLNAAELAIQGPGLNFHEPNCEVIVSEAAWHGGEDLLEMAWATYSGHGLGARIEAVSFRPQQDPYALAGRIAAQGGIDRLQQWATATATAPPEWRLSGQWTTAAELLPKDGTTTVQFDARANNFAAVHKSGQTIQEPAIHLAGQGTFDPQSHTFHLEGAEIHSDLVGGKAQGQFDLSGDVPLVQLDGQVDYDLVRLTELLRLSTEIPLFVSGQHAGPVSYRGSLQGDAAEGTASIRWDGADLFGFLVGPGTLNAGFSDGVLRAQPIQVEVNRGRMTLVPEVRFAGQSPELHLAPGRLAEQVQITPRMCAGALQYIAPVLAGVASAEGTFSIELDACRIPLADPTAGDLSGRFIVHAVQIAPGPLVRQLAAALGYHNPAKLAQQSVVSFRMVEGRVYHRDLQLVFPDMTVRTYGSVGLDQSLALIAEMPVPPKLRTSHEAVNLALKDQIIRLPIGGSLMKPALDQRELERFSREFMQKAAQNVIGNELNRQFDRLFRPQ